MGSQKYSQALQLYDYAINSRLLPHLADTLVASVYAHKSIALLRLGSNVEAVRAAEEAIALDPLWSTPHYVRGYACYRLQWFRAANESFRFIVSRIDPNIKFLLPGGTWLNAHANAREVTEVEFLTVHALMPFNPDHPLLPRDWELAESRKYPGKVFFRNLTTRQTAWRLEEIAMNDVPLTTNACN